MPKPRTCNQQIAIDIRRYGLESVSAAVEMAVELSKAPVVKSTSKTRQLTKKAAASSQPTVDAATL